MVHSVSLATYLEETQIPLRLACVRESGWPVVLSLWYLYDAGALYCATPASARVVAYLTADPRCSFEVASDQPPYCGVRGRTRATIDQERGMEILERLLIRYVGGTDNPLARNLLGRPEPEVAIRLELERTVTWNFSKRMTKPGQTGTKICPS